MTRSECGWLAVASISVLCTLAPAGATIISVDCGDSIQDAVDAAVFPDTTIVIAPCLYPENVEVDSKSSLRLVVAENPTIVGTLPGGVGSPPGGPLAIIDGGGAGPCLSVTGSNRVSVTGLAMTNCLDAGIKVSTTDRLALHSNDLFATGGKGIEVADSSGPIITSNWIRQTVGHGIHLMAVNTGFVADNTVDGASDPGSTGIVIDSGTERTKILRNEVLHSARSGILDRAIETAIERNSVKSSCLEFGGYIPCVCNEIVLGSGSLNADVIGNDVAGGLDWLCASGWEIADNS